MGPGSNGTRAVLLVIRKIEIDGIVANRLIDPIIVAERAVQ